MPATQPTVPAPKSATVSGRATRLALIGGGFIADVHLMVLKSVRNVTVVAVVDPVLPRAQKLAKKYGIGRAHASIDELLQQGEVDAVHVLVPPGLHGKVVQQCLQHGLHVLCEKPLVLREDEVAPLQALAAQQQRVLAVNHNQTCHPALAKLQRHLARGKLGRLEHVTLQHHVPLRQLQTGDVSHFMFQTEANIVLEQGVHLYSMVYALLGAARSVKTITGERKSLPNGVSFVTEWVVQLECERGNATVRMAYGKPWLETTLQAVGSDGAALLDLQRGSCWLRRKTRWLDFLDHGRNLAAGALHSAGRAVGSVAGYCLSLFKLSFPDDPFLRGMLGSLQAFHGAVRGGELPAALSARGAQAVLSMCEQTARAAGVSQSPPPAPPALPAPGPTRPGEVVVLGGTGFLGRRCIKLLRQQGKPVTMVVRKPQLLPAELRDGSVRVFQGDAADAAVLAAAFAGAERVLHLATAAGDDAAAVERTMATAVRIAGEAAQQAGVRQFVYTSSTAALWLGDAGRIDGAVAADPQPLARSAYARGKIAAEKELLALRERGLPLVLVRPAIVVGPDGIAEHSGIGLWVKDNHCVGWGMGRVPLPLVLADDCAKALVAALFAPAALGKSYNLAGDVRLTARDYVAAMRERTGRDYQFHATPLWWMWLQEYGKYLVKVCARRPREWPAYRDFASRSFRTELDCSDAKRDLGWQPETDVTRFLDNVLGGSGR
ncbi:MAG: Gfo/Idh/MocA family oxidoreductase [Planctomycetes bacterium]|nr:Gfo/Idh/MocA family oxidoreductase [Planctomycetota bacterium]